MSPSKLQAFYNAIDVFVNPTLRPQGLDLTLMEAMMSGKPVMASRFRSIKGSIVVDDEFGFMFAPNVTSLLEALELAVKEGSRSLNNFSRNIITLLTTCNPLWGSIAQSNRDPTSQIRAAVQVLKITTYGPRILE
ncbi:hypothetical protein ACLB2K_029805 [Fragaria x ananassa]